MHSLLKVNSYIVCSLFADFGRSVNHIPARGQFTLTNLPLTDPDFRPFYNPVLMIGFSVVVFFFDSSSIGNFYWYNLLGQAAENRAGTLGVRGATFGGIFGRTHRL